MTKFISSMSALAKDYDAFILDLWGVIHDGSHLYPNVKECLAGLHAHKKKIIFLSNAPRRAQTVKDVLTKMGIEESLYDKIITSGEVMYQCLAHPESSFFFKPRGNEFIYIGLEKDRQILKGLHYEEAQKPEFAEFLLLSHSFTDNQPIAELMPLLKECIKYTLPALCTNPDKEVVRLGGERVYCAGVIAEEYSKMGGEVIYFGKPHPAVYDACLEALPGVAKNRIVAVGDSLHTDISGARNSQLASALVTGGILHDVVGDADSSDYKKKCQEICAKQGMFPEYVLSAFNW